MQRRAGTETGREREKDRERLRGEGKEERRRAAAVAGPARWNAGRSRGGSGCLLGAIPGAAGLWAVTARPGPEAGGDPETALGFFLGCALLVTP